jgi:methyl-accepting chemotaxis protein
MWQNLTIRNKVLTFISAVSGITLLCLITLFYFFATRQNFHYLLLLPFISAIVMFSLWIALLRGIIEPVEALHEYALALSEGNTNQMLDMTDSGELGGIGEALTQVANGLNQARQFTQNIGDGNYEVEIGQIDERLARGTLFSALLGMREQLKNIATEEKKRNWLTQGMAEFAEVLRSDDTTLKELGSNIIKGLVDYVEAGQGGLFILNNDNPKNIHLELVACYAYDELQYTQKKIILQHNFGEGLVGQAFLEKSLIYLTNIPDGYLNVISGLGNAPAKSVLIVPLELNNKVEGVIELASFREFEQYEIELIKRLAENITSAILTIKSNENTKKLLHESQELTRQIQAREDEIKRNYEELKATQELVEKNNKLIEAQKKEIEKALEEQNEKNRMLSEQDDMMRKNVEQLIATQVELDGQLNAIDTSSICKIEFDLQGKITTANKAYCELLGYTVKELKNMHHSALLPMTDVDDESVKELWQNLQHGQAQAGEFRRINKKREEVWLNAVYSPVLDQNGKPYKVIKLAFDITEAKQLLVETQKLAEIIQGRAKELEGKNQLITSSIQYAQNIQRAILPSEDAIRKAVQDVFVVYLPKDIVSGDFYWFTHIDNKGFIAVVDCTGHGVPGAFMSIIGNTILNEVINVQHIYEPAKVLELLHAGVRTRLRQAEATNNDGMDISLCRVEPNPDNETEVLITFAGAKRPLYFLKRQEERTYTTQDIQELKGDRKSIGGWQSEPYRTFTQQSITLQKHDYLFLATDGLADAPNSNRKKFGVERIKEILVKNIKLSLDEMRTTLLYNIAQHQRGTDQRDDITLMAVKL